MGGGVFGIDRVTFFTGNMFFLFSNEIPHI